MGDGSDADEPTLVVGEVKEGFRDSLEQNGESDLLVAANEGIEFVRYGEGAMEVRNWEHFRQSGLQPFGGRHGSAFRAVPVAAGVVQDDLLTAVVTLLHPATEESRAADLDGRHHLSVRVRQRVSLRVLLATQAEHVRQFRRVLQRIVTRCRFRADGPVHKLPCRRLVLVTQDLVEQTLRSRRVGACHPHVSCGRAQTAVPQQDLDCA